MANRVERTEGSIEDDVALELGEDISAPVAFEPSYKMSGDSKIPVSKHRGKMWSSRRECSIKAYENVRHAWKQAFDYYRNDQMNHRSDTSGGESRGNTPVNTRNKNKAFCEVENLVYANVTTLLPITYAKNPEVEVTSKSDQLKDIGEVLEGLLNQISSKRSSPGINLKPKARRCILNAELTNHGWLKIGWNLKEHASEMAMQELQKLSEELMEAKSEKEIKAAEQKISALEAKVDFLSPTGATAKVISPFNIHLDPTGSEMDLSDRNWLVEDDMLPTDYLNAVFGKEKDNGEDTKKEFDSIYKPTHVLPAGNDKSNNSTQDMVDNFQLLSSKDDETSDHNSYGYGTLEAFKKGCFTEVSWVWDKVTRRVELYARNNWEWPIWVWDDPLQLQEFYPYYCLSFYNDPDGAPTKGEVTYYLDQQDAINEINSEESTARWRVMNNVFFRKGAMNNPEDLEKALSNPDNMKHGLDISDSVNDLNQVFLDMPMPFAKYPQLFDNAKQNKYQAINRISSMNDVMSGMQFKTNTTNKAIDSYQQSSSIRIDEKIDLIEDFLGAVYWGLTQICLLNMDRNMVEKITSKPAEAWPEMITPNELAFLSLRLVGGSTVKPTSRAKKEEAVSLAQALGQFANAAPMAVVFMMEVLEKAFDEIVMSDEKWDQLVQSVQQSQMNTGGTGQGPAGAAEGGATGGGAEQPLPPEVEAAIQQAVAQGIPEDVAIQMVMEKIGQSQQPQ